ncbi:MAG: hypothetical protein ACQEQJ_00275 [Halobacteriota archaeon]
MGVLGAVLLLGLRLFASQPFLLVIPLSIGMGSGLYLLAGHQRAAEMSWLALPRFVAGYLPSVVMLGLVALVVATRLVGTRTVPIYLLIAGIGTLIFGQILFLDEGGVAPGVILFEILAAAVVIRLSALFVTPGYVGVDIWTHALVFVDGIVAQGSLASIAETKYIMAPIYHAIGAIGTLVFGGVREGIYLTLGLFVPLSAVFVYSTGKLLVPARWALLATALYAFADQFIRWGIHIIPTSLGLVFFLAVVYLVARVFYADAEPWAVLLALGASLAVVFTHQVATAITLVFLAVAAFAAVVLGLFARDGQVTHRMRKAVALFGIFAVTTTATLVSWANTPFAGGQSFLGRELVVIASALTEDAALLNLASSGDAGAGGAAGASAYAWLIPYVELFGFGLLLAAAVLGGLWLLRRNPNPDLSLTFVLAAASLFVLVYGLSLFGIRALLPGRWIAFLFAPMALLAAAGFLGLSRSNARTLVVIAFVVLAVGYPASMVVAEKATLDSPAFSDQHARFAYTAPEISAAQTAVEIRPPAEHGVIRTDHPYDKVFRVIGGYEDGSLVLGPDGPVGADATAARDYQLQGPVSFESPEDGTIGDPATVCPDWWNTVYANDQVCLCTDSTGGAE